MSNDGADRTSMEQRSLYDLMRAKHGIVPFVSLSRKIRWCSYLALVAALVGPIIVALPDSVREAYFAGDPLSTSLGAAAVVLVGVSCLALASVGLALLAVRLPDAEPSESQIWQLIGIEDALTGIAFITGALGVFSGVGILATGLAGLDRVEWLVAGGVDPYFPLEGFPMTPTVTTVAGVATAVVAFGLSVFVRRE